MAYLLVILIGTVLVNTFLLMRNDQLLSGTRHEGAIASAIRIGGATSVVLISSALVTAALWELLGSLPQDVLLFFFALVVVASAVALDRLTGNRSPKLQRALSTSPILTISNSLAIGTGLLTPIGEGVGAAISNAMLLSVSFIAAVTMFVALVSRVAIREVPVAFRSTPITLVTAGLFTLALMGFTGLLRG
jgi:Na+-translocating ferredoxin:NAD+ oxidoreductase subunit A